MRHSLGPLIDRPSQTSEGDFYYMLSGKTVVVRKSAGAALVSIIDQLPLEQRNEIAVELGKGLEIGDYQFSKYIPDYGLP